MAFRDVIGQPRLIGLLSRAVARGSLPPSLIFGGPEGVGKATTALALAEVVNCERLPPPGTPERSNAGDACGACGSCRRLVRAAQAFRAGERPAIDCLQWLAPDDRASIKIDAVRSVLARAGYRPFDGRERVVIVDGAETLEVGAQQALLKVLEEPPPSTRFVLVTAQPDSLLPTIRSRCPQLRFGPMTPADIASALVTRFAWTEADARAAAALADGRLGQALRAGDATMREAREVAVEVLEHVLASRRPLDRLAAAQALAVRGETSKGGRRGATATRQEMAGRLDAMAAVLRDIGVLTSHADRGRLANTDLAPRLDAMARAFSAERLGRAFEAVDTARSALERNASQKIVADWVALHL